MLVIGDSTGTISVYCPRRIFAQKDQTITLSNVEANEYKGRLQIRVGLTGTIMS